jgi:hypothetical protein
MLQWTNPPLCHCVTETFKQNLSSFLSTTTWKSFQLFPVEGRQSASYPGRFNPTARADGILRRLKIETEKWKTPVREGYRTLAVKLVASHAKIFISFICILSSYFFFLTWETRPAQTGWTCLTSLPPPSLQPADGRHSPTAHCLRV